MTLEDRHNVLSSEAASLGERWLEAHVLGLDKATIDSHLHDNNQERKRIERKARKRGWDSAWSPAA